MKVKFEFIAVTVLPLIFNPTSTHTSILQELPSQNDTFECARNQNKVYVDKSGYIEKLLESEDRFFLMCRPGRFGKSNFMQMLKSFFEGRKELFKDMEIYEKHDWQTSYPVIYLDFSGEANIETLQLRLLEIIIEMVKLHGIQVDTKFPLSLSNVSSINDTLFGQLMYHITQHGKQQIVVLIDEYDWPLRRNCPRQGSDFESYNTKVKLLGDRFITPVLRLFEHYRNYIKLLFVTCTVKMNYTTNAECPVLPLKDITFDPQFSSMIGLTGQELERNFKPHIDAMISEPEETFYTIVKKLRKKYNGYCFAYKNASLDTKCGLYNFHSVISCLRNKNSDYLWHPAANPKYNVIDDYSIDEIEEASDWFEKILISTHRNQFEVAREALENEAHQTYAEDKIPMVVSMVLYGYLTFHGFDEKTDHFFVDFPNEEMRESYRRVLLKVIYGRDLPSQHFVNVCKNLFESMQTKRAATFVEQLNSLAFTPHEDNKIRSEDWLQRYSADRIAGVFRACELSLRENLPDQYRDLRVEFSQKIYVHEMKYQHTYDGLRVKLPKQCDYWIHFDFNRSAASATNVLLRNVSEGDALVDRSQPIHLMGVNFNERSDAIEKWIRITYSRGKCEDLQASNSMFLKMYSYLADVEAYSSLP